MWMLSAPRGGLGCALQKMTQLIHHFELLKNPSARNKKQKIKKKASLPVTDFFLVPFLNQLSFLSLLLFFFTYFHSKGL